MLPVVVPRSEVRLLAVAIMSNHLHLVVQQGSRTVDKLMQPLLCRLARRVQRVHDLEGPIFWPPYLSRPCHDPRHARNAIVYVHLNAVRAGICSEPDRYPWTSHGLYAPGGTESSSDAGRTLAPVLDPTIALPLFAAGADRSGPQLRDDYLGFVRWRLERDQRAEVEFGPDSEPVDPMQLSPSPVSDWGDRAWGSLVTPLFHSPAQGSQPVQGDLVRGYAPEMDAIARGILGAESGGLRMERIRGRGGGPETVRLRNLIIRRAHAAGYRNTQIADYLGLSESAVWYHIRVWQRTA